ncbi:MAG: hypothetical protein JRI23_14760 [Deltaproteobacteria bacterium]|jgi:hypothetical protein|nr:hypothetical protein [Deltaproteobacteria bacterium]MBW2533010.1 hypothetical protein [Deltaproteobacteria bacterium]
MRFVQTLRWSVALAGAAALSLSVSCEDEDLDPAGLVQSLRVIAVTADSSYPQPGDQVTMRLTFADALEDAPRPIEVAWISGCIDPPGGAYYGCFPELVAALESAGEGAAEGYRVRRDVYGAEWSGAPGAAPFTVTVPVDALATGVDVATAYVFFTVCAGRVLPASLQPGADRIEFPLVCVDDQGNELGPDSFVPGFAELFVFRDGRHNANPPVEGILIGSVQTGSSPEAAPIVALCPERDEQGCAPAFGPGAQNNQQQEPCKTYRIQAQVPDVAEVVPGKVDAEGAPLRETVWVRYYVDGGELERDDVLVSDAAAGYRGSFEALWTPPSEPGLVTLWAVAHDSRGGASVRRAVVRVE